MAIKVEPAPPLARGPAARDRRTWSLFEELAARGIPVEAAHVMGPDDGSEPDIYPDFRRILGPELPLQRMGRFEFYDQARGPDLALAIATGEQRIYANILLTIGVVPPTKQ